MFKIYNTERKSPLGNGDFKPTVLVSILAFSSH